MSLFPALAFAFTAGMLASVNPCGFAMLPAFLSYQLTSDTDGSPDEVARTLAGLRLSLFATLGFISIFMAVGAALMLGGRGLISLTPWAALIVGLLLMILGLWSLLTKRELPLRVPAVDWNYTSRSPRNMVLFGIGYAVASLGCTLPAFLAIVGSALAVQSLAASLTVFLSYALGMGSVLAAVSLGAVLFQGLVAQSLKRVVPYVHTISALALIGAGLYLIYYQLSATLLLNGGL